MSKFTEFLENSFVLLFVVGLFAFATSIGTRTPWLMMAAASLMVVSFIMVRVMDAKRLRRKHQEQHPFHSLIFSLNYDPIEEHLDLFVDCKHCDYRDNFCDPSKIRSLKDIAAGFYSSPFPKDHLTFRVYRCKPESTEFVEPDLSPIKNSRWNNVPMNPSA